MTHNLDADYELEHFDELYLFDDDTGNLKVKILKDVRDSYLGYLKQSNKEMILKELGEFSSVIDDYRIGDEEFRVRFLEFQVNELEILAHEKEELLKERVKLKVENLREELTKYESWAEELGVDTEVEGDGE